MWLLNVRKLGFDTASNFALGLPKHDIGWPSLRPLFRDNIFPDTITDIEMSQYNKENGTVLIDCFKASLPPDQDDQENIAT